MSDDEQRDGFAGCVGFFELSLEEVQNRGVNYFCDDVWYGLYKKTLVSLLVLGRLFIGKSRCVVFFLLAGFYNEVLIVHLFLVFLCLL